MQRPALQWLASQIMNELAGANELQILRDNLAFGTIGAQELGTYFVGYARHASVTTTGSQFFVPSTGLLDDLPAAPGG